LSHLTAVLLADLVVNPLSVWQIYPFKKYKSKINKELGVDFSFKNTADIKDATSYITDASKIYDVYVFRPQWDDVPDDVIQFCQLLRDKIGASKKIILVDPFDQTSSRFFEATPYVDSHLKYLCLKNEMDYLQDFIGGNFMTHQLAASYGIDIGDWHVGSNLASKAVKKVKPSWFLVETSIIKSVLRRNNSFLKPFYKQNKKDIDVFCHINCGDRNDQIWYGKHRSSVIDVLSELPETYTTSIAAEYVGEQRISRSEYISRGKRAKIMVSPLGWGEVTMRGFEAILNRSLYFQPDVNHIITEPNIFIPFETYIPVAWDFSDLNEKKKYL